MAGELYHSHVLPNFRGLKPLPVSVPESGLLNICGGRFESRRLTRRNGLGGGEVPVAKCNIMDFSKKPRHPRENIKMWNSVKASKLPDSPYTYHNNEAVTSINHTVTEGQTLTSIARQYETSVEEIASVNHIDNFDMIESGQLLVVPVHHKISKRVSTITMDLNEIRPKNKIMLPASTVATTSVPQPGPTISSPLSLRFVKGTLLFLLLAPALAYCIRWSVHSIRLQMDEVYEQETEEKTSSTHHKTKHARWHSILEDDAGTTALDSSPKGYSPTESQENRGKDAYKEICDSYAELEPAYLKFLAESGLTNSGYWRGGLPSTSDENII
ncbi:hypothetical protein SUGI_0645640 [Cryptomeria japonica]|uniref:uncharacterized protein LOC131041269 isoform X2 n=1 Tax=Cryptomeria japonica TaxID=3369 RepID=UPI002414AA64|nr:uncharacterized protein LOC131041269 isoform X2 [Cryptomeria japonica]GLJ32061.1 hypothetical protein SUGI_0645640 [Cryptomeria japonica]